MPERRRQAGGTKSSRSTKADEPIVFWRPIRTAPKDGASIIVAWIQGDDVGQIDIGAWEPLNADGDLGWATDRGDLHREPTHWAPLPRVSQKIKQS